MNMAALAKACETSCRSPPVQAIVALGSPAAEREDEEQVADLRRVE